MKKLTNALVLVLIISALAACVGTPEPVETTQTSAETALVVSTAETPAELPDATSAASDEGWEASEESAETELEVDETESQSDGETEADATSAASDEGWN